MNANWKRPENVKHGTNLRLPAAGVPVCRVPQGKRRLSGGVSRAEAGLGVKLRPLRRLHGLCLYCGRPSRTDVCGFCSDLPVRDPLVSKARQPLSEQERIDSARLPERTL